MNNISRGGNPLKRADLGEPASVRDYFDNGQEYVTIRDLPIGSISEIKLALSALANNITALNNKCITIDDINPDNVVTSNDLENINDALNNNTERLATSERTLETQSGNITANSEYITNHETKLADHDQKFNENENRHAQHETRLTENERRLGDHQQHARSHELVLTALKEVLDYLAKQESNFTLLSGPTDGQQSLVGESFTALKQQVERAMQAVAPAPMGGGGYKTKNKKRRKGKRIKKTKNKKK